MFKIKITRVNSALMLCAVLLLGFGLVWKTSTAEEFYYETYLAVDHPNYIDDWPKLKNGFALIESNEIEIQRIIDLLTLEQKIGQMIQIRESSTIDDMDKIGIGSVRFDEDSTTELKYLDRMWEYSEEYALDNNQFFIPPSFVIEATHGHSNNYKSIMFPHAIGLGAANDTDLVNEISSATAKQILNEGYDWHLGIYAAPIRNKLNGDNYLHFSEDSIAQLPLIKNYYQGLLKHDVITTARGFIGKGGLDFDFADLDIKRLAMLNLYGLPQIEALEQGVQVVELSANSINSITNVTNKTLITDELKLKMGFNGVVMSPLNAATNISGCWVGSCAKMINAGVDVIFIDSRIINFDGRGFNEFYFDSVTQFHKNTVESVNNGEILLQRIDDAVRRVLRVKMSVDLLNKPKPSLRKTTDVLNKKDIADFSELAKVAAKKSAVLLKNNGIIPIAKNKKVLVIGAGSDHLYRQIGGHNGDIIRRYNLKNKNKNKKRRMLIDELKELSSNVTHIQSDEFNVDSALAEAINLYSRSLRGLKIAKRYKYPFDGLKHNISSKNYADKQLFKQHFYLRVRRYLEQFDIIVLVLADEPYAGSSGDKQTLAFSTIYNDQFRLFNEVTSLNSQLVVVSFTGTAYYQPLVMNAADAFIQAWYPGTNVEGIAELIIENDNISEFEAMLPITWPISPCSFKGNVGTKYSMSAFDFAFKSLDSKTDDFINLPIIDDCKKSKWEKLL
ncbi:MAG: glycoside hydrolase family 3 C-terminal domain-containing protein [Saccharospirillaceae bacterium]|nr:glycoside hydrolase family 3 C-terminal domain-containing protein [Pseudomonadales bacterium]NRB78736.1 glycoside hydrolase family 3 C-terminal domain-containing protein [Saccharospirillaceae bacterium]